MEISIKGNGDGFDFRLKVNWLSLVQFCKAAAVTVITLLAAREIEQLGTLFGLW